MKNEPILTAAVAYEVSSLIIRHKLNGGDQFDYRGQAEKVIRAEYYHNVAVNSLVTSLDHMN